MIAMRMTIPNPDGKTFRIPLVRAGHIRITANETSDAIFGDVVDRLAAYESLGEPEEIQKIIELYNRHKK